MVCTECGHDNSAVAAKDPWCMYKFENGQVVNKLFDPDKIPKGWFDSPKAAKAGKKTSKATSEGLTV
ncbi:MAG: hypothetical protein JKY22_12090 [Flavobacteriaceae bacterium]|nr:hypothetical protein [Flavobacteriaceae bacterium]PCJ26489.1 MAG: hypothetical protein COA94_05110 [Rickettsiales bacterium]